MTEIRGIPGSQVTGLGMSGSNKGRDVFNFEEIGSRRPGGLQRRMGEWWFENATGVSGQAYWLHSCQVE